VPAAGKRSPPINIEVSAAGPSASVSAIWASVPAGLTNSASRLDWVLIGAAGLVAATVGAGAALVATAVGDGIGVGVLVGAEVGDGVGVGVLVGAGVGTGVAVSGGGIAVGVAVGNGAASLMGVTAAIAVAPGVARLMVMSYPDSVQAR
jgi:hypothetical protein